jgi:hypothetical protein
VSYNKVLIASRARSGTQLLAHSLAAPGDGQTVNRGEAFIRARGSLFASVPEEVHARAVYPPACYLKPEVRQVVAVVHWDGLSAAMAETLVNQQDLIWIVLRRDIVPRLASLKTAWQTQQWNLFNEEDRVEAQPVTIHPAELMADAELDASVWEAIRRVTSDRVKHVQWVNYWDMTLRWEEFLEQLQERFGLLVSESQVTIQQNHLPLEERVENYEQLKQELGRRPWWNH